jgi:catechol 2,3-dioxygenase-like lactoylglutathione lyase family enzyme
VAVRQLRLVVTASDYDEAVRFYRDVLGLPERAAVSAPDRRVAILDAGLATLELAEPAAAEFIDRVEVGRRVAGHIRVALEVDDVQATVPAQALLAHTAGLGLVSLVSVSPRTAHWITARPASSLQQRRRYNGTT